MLSAPYFSTAARDGSIIYLGSEYFVMAIDLKTHEQKYLVPSSAHWKKIKDAFIPLTEDQSINKLLQVVRAYLPEGWSESYESQDRCLEVFRDKAVEIETGALANGPPDKEKPVPVKQKFTFAFRIVAMVSPADHHRLTSQLGQDAAALYDKLLEMRVSHKAGSFSPRTDAEKAMVARYEALQHELHSLPDFYFRCIGLQAQFDPAALPETKFSDARVRDECARIQQGILNLLSRYEDAPTSALPPRPPVADP